MQQLKVIVFVLLLHITHISQADMLTGINVPENAYLDGGASKYAVILCHGRDKHPTWLVVDPLRKGIHKKLGYHTVSIQMPKGDVNWQDYAYYFPDAYSRIRATVAVLKTKGIEHIYLMGHSMGSRMASAYLATEKSHGIKGFIGLGIRNRGDYPLDSADNLSSVTVPVVDIYGDGGNAKDVEHAQERANLVSKKYTQVFISGANHKFEGREEQMINAVVNWLKNNK